MNGTWKRGRNRGNERGRGTRQKDGHEVEKARRKPVPRQTFIWQERDMCELILRPPLSLPLSLSLSFQEVFELLNKNSGLCIKLQFGKTKLSGGIIILISKKKIKPLQIFLDYSALGDLFLPPSSSSSTIVEIFPTHPTDTWKPLIITP